MAEIKGRFGILSVVVMFSAIFLLGCTAGPRVPPDVTSYPRDKTETRPVTMVFTPTYLLGVAASLMGSGASGNHQSLTGWKPTVEYEETVVGDKAEFESFIVPRDPSEHSEEFLFSRVDEVGGNLCPEEFIVVRSTYFYGSEATLQMLDIYTPALRVVVRCSIELDEQGDEHFINFNEMSSIFDDYKFFDHSTVFVEIEYDKFVQSFRAFLAQKGMPVVEDRAAHNGLFLAAGLDPDDRRSGRLERVTAFIRSHDSGTELTFRLFAYQISEHRRGVMATEQRGFSYGSRPWDRRVAYDRATLFLGELFQYLGMVPEA